MHKLCIKFILIVTEDAFKCAWFLIYNDVFVLLTVNILIIYQISFSIYTVTLACFTLAAFLIGLLNTTSFHFMKRFYKRKKCKS